MRSAEARVTFTEEPEPGMSAASNLPADVPAARRDARGANLLVWEGDAFRIEFEGDVFFLKDAMGLRYLTILFSTPGRRVAASELVERAGSLRESAAQARDVTEERKASRRQLLVDLRAELEEAQGNQDRGRAERILAAIERITDELVAAVRDDSAERTRKRVSRAVRLVLAKIARECPPLAEHLELTLRTGATCVYQPDPRSGVRWQCRIPKGA